MSSLFLKGVEKKPFNFKIRFSFSLPLQGHKGSGKPVSPELFHQKAARSLLALLLLLMLSCFLAPYPSQAFCMNIL